MQGEVVIVRALGGRPLVRHLWAADDGAVYISVAAEYAKLANGQADALIPVGFPREDVFVYDPELAEAVERGAFGDDGWDWSKLKRWGEEID